MKEHLDSEIIQKLIKYYNTTLSKTIDGLRFDPEHTSEIKEEMLIGALNYCYIHKSRFDPTKKGNSTAYFATIFKSYVIHEVVKLQKDKSRIISMRRERKLNDLLDIPNPNPTIYNI